MIFKDNASFKQRKIGLEYKTWIVMWQIYIKKIQVVNVNGLNILLKRLRSLDWIQTITFLKDVTEKEEL